MSHVPVQTKKTLTKTYDYPTELNTNYDAETTSDVEKINYLRKQKGEIKNMQLDTKQSNLNSKHTSVTSIVLKSPDPFRSISLPVKHNLILHYEARVNALRTSSINCGIFRFSSFQWYEISESKFMGDSISKFYHISNEGKNRFLFARSLNLIQELNIY